MSLSALAQNHPYPGSVAEGPVICSGCPGTNAAGQPNHGKPTTPYDVPVIDHAGRYVDSSSTATVQHLGMRTVRAEMIRINPANGRIYVELGAAIGAYTADTFFTGRLAEPIVPVSVMVTGSTYGGRDPLEKVARPDGFIYPEAKSSGWSTPLTDGSERLHDIDVDDRGHVYYRSSVYGWGIHKDDGRTDGKMLPFVAQVPDPAQYGDPRLFTMKVAALDEFRYYAYVTDASTARLFDVTVPAAPVQVGETRAGSTYGVREWAKNEGEGHVAVLNGNATLRVYTYAAILDGSAPVVEHVLPAGRSFGGLAYDQHGNLWVGEGGGTSAGTLWKLSAGGYEKTTYTLSASQFRPDALHAAAGYVAVAGSELFGSARKRNLQLLRVVDGTPEPVDTANWFRDYYHAAPSGYAQPAGYTNNRVHPFLFVENGLTYLFYSAFGLGDVYELGAELRPPGLRILSISPEKGPAGGGTVVTVNGRNFGQDAVVSFDDTAATTTFVSSNQLTAIAPPHNAGAVTVYVSSNGDVATGPKFTYALGAPANFSATATSDSNVLLTWNAVAGAATYDVFYLNDDGTATKFGTTSALSFNHGGRVPAMGYIYYVRARDGAGNLSPESLRDAATTVQFTDAAIVPGMRLRGYHLNEIRIAVNRLRLAAGAPQLNWTSSIEVLAVQYEELRTAVAEGRRIARLPPVAFSDLSLAGVAIKAAHMQELMSAVR